MIKNLSYVNIFDPETNGFSIKENTLLHCCICHQPIIPYINGEAYSCLSDDGVVTCGKCLDEYNENTRKDIFLDSVKEECPDWHEPKEFFLNNTLARIERCF